MTHPVSCLDNGPRAATMADVKSAGDKGLKVVHFTLFAPPDTLVLALDANGEVGPRDPRLRDIAYQTGARFTPQLYGLEHCDCECCGEPPDEMWPVAFCVAWREQLPVEHYQATLESLVERAPHSFCSRRLDVEHNRPRRLRRVA